MDAPGHNTAPIRIRKTYWYVLIILYQEHLNGHMYLIQVPIASIAIESKFGPSNAHGRARAHQGRYLYPKHLLACSNYVIEGNADQTFVYGTSANSIYNHRKQNQALKR